MNEIIGGYDNRFVIFRIGQWTYAMVDTVEPKNTRINYYWLYLAKYTAIYDAMLLDEELVKKAKEALESLEIDAEKTDEMFAEKAKRLKDIRKEQEKLLEQSRRSKKGIYLD